MPFEYMSAVSIKLPPPSMKRLVMAIDAASSQPQPSMPKVIVPKQIRETNSPESPKYRYFIMQLRVICEAAMVTNWD